MTTPSVAPIPSATAPSSGTSPAQLAGIAWLATAAITAYLAFQQWTVGSQLANLGLGDQGLTQTAIFNAADAALTAYFGAKCLQRPTRGFLGTSAAWGAVDVAWGVYQVTAGVTAPLFFLTIIGSGLAGVLSWTARREVAK